jgi:hypothetical protein
MVRKRVKKNNNNGNKSVAAKSAGPTRALVPVGIRQQRQSRIPRGRLNFGSPKLSQNGLAFLKCAFASPDFSVDPGKGIPDQFHGRTLSIKDCFTTALNFAAGLDTYILIAPVPGYAYFVGTSTTVGGPPPTTFVGVPFPTYETNFGATGIDSDNKFSKYRYASLAAGLYPTSNFMQFSGSIQVWRVDLNLAETSTTAVTAVGPPVTTNPNFLQKRIQGLQGVTTLVPRDNYSESFIKGAYTFAFDKTQDFEWQDFVSAPTYIQSNAVGASSLDFDGTHRLTGLGNVNTLVYKISTPVAAVNTALFRVWNCIELQPDTNSSLFQFSGVSPEHDPLAMEMYSNMKMRFPVAMPCSENAKFWENVLRMIRTLSQAGSFIPGPAGLISGGVNTIAEAISHMMM